MKKLIALSFLAILVISGCSSAEPVAQMLSPIGSAHVEGDDVYIEAQGKYHIAKGQREVYEKKTGEFMTVIAMSDGSYVIKDNDKVVQYENGFTHEQQQKEREEREKAKAEQAIADKERQERLEEERAEHLRSLKTHQQEMDKARAELKAEKQETLLEMAKQKLQAQLNGAGTK